jgi:hypothetical protein
MGGQAGFPQCPPQKKTMAETCFRAAMSSDNVERKLRTHLMAGFGARRLSLLAFRAYRAGSRGHFKQRLQGRLERPFQEFHACMWPPDRLERPFKVICGSGAYSSRILVRPILVLYILYIFSYPVWLKQLEVVLAQLDTASSVTSAHGMV